jgi:nucleotidyltransferase substrate binding protein (TIGR01987 family)
MKGGVMLELGNFKKAIDSLENLLKETENKEFMENLNPVIYNGLIAGVIQNFEFTYELSWKYMKRWLENNIGNSEVDGVSRRQLFRLAIENKLIDDVDIWMDFHVARNRTSHTYDFDTAEKVYEVSKEFLIEVKKLLKEIEIRND